MGLRFQVSKILRNGYFAGHVSYIDPDAAGTDEIVTVGNLTNKSWTIAGQPDYPRNLVLTVVDTTPGITAGTVTVVGVGAYGQAVTETFDCSAGAGTYTGNVAFATVTSVTTASFATLGGSGDETFKVGVGTKLGLPCYRLKAVYKACVDDANETIGTTSTTYGTIIPNTAANGTRDYDFWYTYYPVPEVY